MGIKLVSSMHRFSSGNREIYVTNRKRRALTLKISDSVLLVVGGGMTGFAAL